MYSQVHQDEVAHKLCKNGFFVDIGAGDGFFDPNGGNSLYLEEMGWSGLLIEGDPNRHMISKANRKSTSILAMIPDYPLEEILKNNNCPNVIDYLSIDIEPSSLIALENFPFSNFRFKFLTFEHDFYAKRDNGKCKDRSFEILTKMGYHCFAENVLIPELDGHSKEECFFEDWWVNPDFFSSDFLSANDFKQKSGQFILNNIKL
jgi:hypothetical protein